MPETTQMGIMSLIPLTITLVLAFWKKDAIFALLIGCLSGVLLLGMDPAFGFSALAEEAGVVHAFAKLIASKVKTPRQIKFATWFIGLFTVDDYMSPLLRGVLWVKRLHCYVDCRYGFLLC